MCVAAGVTTEFWVQDSSPPMPSVSRCRQRLLHEGVQAVRAVHREALPVEPKLRQSPAHPLDIALSARARIVTGAWSDKSWCSFR